MFESLKTIVRAVLEKTGSVKSELNKSARVCESFLLTIYSPDEALEFLRMSKLQYPEELYFHTSLCFTLFHLKKYEEARCSAKKSLQIFPNNYDLVEVIHATKVNGIVRMGL